MLEALVGRTMLGTAQGAALRVHGDPAQVALREMPMAAMFDVRLQPSDAALVAAAEAAFALALPLAPNKSTAANGRTALWLGPDQWLIVAHAVNAPVTAPELAGSASVVDVGDLRAVFELAGPHARDVLAKGCAVDLHPRAFQPGDCALSALARIRVALHQPAADNAYVLYVERSYAQYLWDWLIDAMVEYTG